MLRGYSRHDGISNKQSAKERDRDRQRERQRQERAQMLPNDDKDISTSAHDLFHAPVKVDPSVEDPTTLEIRNTLGNFESVRHILVDGPVGRSLIGVDQNSNASAVHNPRSGPHRPGQPGSKNLIPNRNYPHNIAVNNSNNLQNNHKPTTQKVPQSQNQLPHHLSQPGNTSNSSNSGVNNPPGQTNIVKKSNVYNINVNTNNTSGSVDNPSTNNAVKVDKNLINNSGGSLSQETGSADNTNEKYVRDFPTRKPALERADSQLELESILQEMMDVTAPITAIQTPAKESPAKKYTPRRPSKSEEILETIRDGMNVSPAITDMESSESSSSDTESSGSDSEDSSSGSQGGQEHVDLGSKPAATANSPARWDLSSFMRKDYNVRGTPDSSGATTTKSPKDGKLRENPLTSSTIDSEESPGEVPVKLESSVTSTSIFGKSLSSSPVENATSGGKYTKSANVPHATHLDVVEGQYPKVPGKSPRKTPDVKLELSSKLPPQTIPMKGPQIAASGAAKLASLSATSSEDEDKKPKEPLRPPPEKSKNQSGANKRKWRSSPSPEHRRGHKSDDDDSSPEAETTKSQAVQDENKINTIRNIFRPSKRTKGKMDSPSVENEGTKSNTGNSASGGGRGKGAKPAAPNRVSAKDSGRKSNSSTTIFVHNGDLDSKKNSSSNTSTAPRKRESNVKDSATSHSSSHHNKKRSHKPHSSATSSSHKNSNEGTTATSNANPAVISANPSIAGSRIKDEPVGKSHPSSLMCRIPLSVLLRRPPIPPNTTSSNVKSEKDSDKGGGGSACALLGNSDSSHRVRLHYDSGRVGSSSDHASNALHHDPVTDRQRDDPLCSDSEPPSSKRKRQKKKPRSPKKIPKKLEPDSISHSKVKLNCLEEDSSVVEVSSNVFGYTSCDSVSVSTTRTPPVELDIAPAPDSSLNPPHLPSPVVPPQPIYYSFFEKNDTQHHEDYYSRDQDQYLEEAKRLKHKADNEKLSTTQASTYLEAGLYFILTGLSMERDRAVGSQSAFTMYKDTLSLIRYIGTRFRSARADYSNAMEAKIIVLSMRCQSLLSLKLFKIKTRETKDIVQYLSDHFSKAPPVENAPIPHSPQLSTPSPHSPTSSPAGSTGILQVHTPSPHPHQNHLHTTVPRSIYSQMYKHYNNTYNLMQAHELWEAADSLVERYHMEEFFVSIDRQYGPLTLHNSLVDLVRYVKHCLKVLKICSDIS